MLLVVCCDQGCLCFEGFIYLFCVLYLLKFAVMLGVHKVLKQVYPDLVTIIVPRYPQHGKDIAQV
jgi:hypothetical protein